MRNTILALLLFATGGAFAEPAFTVRSADIESNRTLKPTQVYQGFGCTGGNLSPQLEWSGAPAGTRSFAVTVYDPDAPTGSGWWHWVAYDIPVSTNRVETGAGKPGGLPPGVRQARNDYGTPDFGGACPPPGDKPHRYIVTVHALKVDKLGVPVDASPALVGYMLNANGLATATLTGLYGR